MAEKQGLINLVSRLSSDDMREVANEVVKDYDNDIASRASWELKRERWYKLWLCERDKKTTPWVGASNVCVPILLTSCNQFHSRAYQAIFAAPGIVRAMPVEAGDASRAKRVEDFMNWQTTYEMEDYEEEWDKLLINLPINGTAFKKTYYDKALDRNVSEYISALDVVLPYSTKRLETARRIVHRLWLHYDEMEERHEDGFYENFDDVHENASKLDESQIKQTADQVVGTSELIAADRPHLVLECHKKYKMPWDQKKEPYILTIDYDSRTILRLTSRKVKIGKKEHVLNFFTDYHFFPNPEGFYSFGFGHFLENLNEMANTAFNQMFDSGRLTNSPFGFYGRRAGFKKRKIKISPGQMTEVEDPSQVVFPQMQRVDQVLFQALGAVNTFAERISANTDLLSGRQQSGVREPTKGGTLAVIEQGLVAFGVLTKRIFRQSKKELGLMFKLNSLYLSDEKQFRVLGSEKYLPFSKIKRKDFASQVDIIPVADPTFASRSGRRDEAISLYQLLLQNPIVGLNPKTGELGYPQGILKATSDLIDTFEKQDRHMYLPEIPDPQISPEAENALFMQGDAREPQVGEDHQAHLQSHGGFIESVFYTTLGEERRELVARHIQATQQLMLLEQQAQERQPSNNPDQDQPQRPQSTPELSETG